MSLHDLNQRFNYAYLDEGSKREIRRAVLKALAIPGYQVPFGSRELPIARGWGTGGIQLTLSLIGPHDVLKVIDQGSDDSVNAVSIRNLVTATTDVETTTITEEATIIQSRHRIPDNPLRADQILVLQVPQPEPLRQVEPSERVTRRMHAEGDYSAMWLSLYEDIVHYGEITIGSDYPAMVNRRYMIKPTPIPRWDLPKLHQAPFLTLFGAGRERKIYAIPPHTEVVPLEFEDYPFEVETFSQTCHLCGSADSFLDELYDSVNGEKTYQCSDTAYCRQRRREKGEAE